jgi:hypothetical protein
VFSTEAVHFREYPSPRAASYFGGPRARKMPLGDTMRTLGTRTQHRLHRAVLERHDSGAAPTRRRSRRCNNGATSARSTAKGTRIRSASSFGHTSSFPRASRFRRASCGSFSSSTNRRRRNRANGSAER